MKKKKFSRIIKSFMTIAIIFTMFFGKVFAYSPDYKPTFWGLFWSYYLWQLLAVAGILIILIQFFRRIVQKKIKGKDILSVFLMSLVLILWLLLVCNFDIEIPFIIVPLLNIIIGIIIYWKKE